MLLTKEQLKSRPSVTTEDVDLPSFGGKVRVRAMFGDEHDVFQAFIKDRTGDGIVTAAMVAASVIDESGARIFDMNGDIEAIRQAWPQTELQKVFDVAARLNSFGKKGLEDAEKN